MLSNATKFSKRDTQIILSAHFLKNGEEEEEIKNDASYQKADGIPKSGIKAKPENVAIVEFSVRDSGEGISAEDQRLLFQAFSQVSLPIAVFKYKCIYSYHIRGFRIYFIFKSTSLKTDPSLVVLAARG